MGLTQAETIQFLDTVTAAAMATKAVLACLIAGKPVTVENCAIAYGAWMMPDSPHFERFVLAVNGHVEQILAAGALLSPSAEWH